MSKYRNIKVHVPTPEISGAVQKKLFEDGVKWWSGSVGLKYLGKRFLAVDEKGRLSAFYDGEEGFKECQEKEVPYQSILDPLYDVKIAWANGEAVQYRFKGDDGWIDWGHKASIHIGGGEEWRVKPKTKTIKQWERKYLQGDIVMTMVVSDPDDSNNMECWIGEAYEAEYEVSND